MFGSLGRRLLLRSTERSAPPRVSPSYPRRCPPPPVRQIRRPAGASCGHPIYLIPVALRGPIISTMTPAPPIRQGRLARGAARPHHIHPVRVRVYEDPRRTPSGRPGCRWAPRGPTSPQQPVCCHHPARRFATVGCGVGGAPAAHPDQAVGPTQSSQRSPTQPARPAQRSPAQPPIHPRTQPRIPPASQPSRAASPTQPSQPAQPSAAQPSQLA